MTTTTTNMAVTDTPRARRALRVVPAVRTVEGAGFVVRRPFPRVGLQQVDPFLLVDELGPVQLAPGEAQGAPDHPHRGFETVTYILEGESEHRDSAGNAGRLGPGDVQWMTAGAGVVHSEMPSVRLQREGGRMHGFQVWVNLPRDDKRMRPRYQELKAASIPVVHTPDGRVRVKVVAGEALGVRAATETRTPIAYLHLTLQPGATFTQPVPAAHQAMAYVFGGRGEVAGRAVGDGELVLLTDGDTVELHNTGTEAMELLLLSGVPLREPMVRYGPFVMNTEQELHEAFDDFRAGRMGSIPPQTS